MVGDRLKRTGFTDIHESLGARLVPFAGFLMPIQYESMTAEHHAVRERAGVFDISHMGEFELEGPGALDAVQGVTVNDASALAIDQAQYTAMVDERGGIIDDCVLYRLEDDRYMLVVNAANIEKDWAHLEKHLPAEGVTMTDRSDTISLLAVQGPDAEGVVAAIAGVPVDDIDFYWKRDGTIADVPAIVSRTGYTGEDGFELYFEREHSRRVWDALFDAGGPRLSPCGLGARDTLRLEMRYALYGSDIDETVNPFEAGLGWIVKLEPGGFVGEAALRRVSEAGVERRLAGFRLVERGIPRAGYPLSIDGRQVAEVRSGAMSPTLGYGIGTGYLPVAHAKAGTEIEVNIRDRQIRAEVVKPPFYTGGSLRR